MSIKYYQDNIQIPSTPVYITLEVIEDIQNNTNNIELIQSYIDILVKKYPLYEMEINAFIKSL